MYVQDHKMVTKGEYLRTKSIQSEFFKCFESENENFLDYSDGRRNLVNHHRENNSFQVVLYQFVFLSVIVLNSAVSNISLTLI